MPDHANASAARLEDGLRRMKIQEDGGGKTGLPERPGEQDCMYYMRTGACGYGSGCRYNHPVRAGQGRVRDEVAPRRGGAGDGPAQQDCQYFLRTGTCKFGSICKYQHPQNRHDSRPVSLNLLGLPIRQDEKSCPYYMRNGSCKFGIACKFSHPPPATLGATFPSTGHSAYASAGSSMAPPSGVPIIGGYSPWALPRNPYMSSPGMPGLPGYMPVLPPSQGTIPGWSAYTVSLNEIFENVNSIIRKIRPIRIASVGEGTLPRTFSSCCVLFGQSRARISCRFLGFMLFWPRFYQANF